MGTARSWTLWVCPECGHVMDNALWDDQDADEKGPPACPERMSTGCFDVDMKRVLVVALDDVLEALREQVTRQVDETTVAYAAGWQMVADFLEARFSTPEGEGDAR